MSTATSWRSGAAVNTMLVAALATGVFVASYDLASSPDSAILGGTSAAPTTNAEGEVVGANAPFTTADVGTCLNWEVAEDGAVANFQQTPCEQEHRFEVSKREDLGIYPTSEFGPDADMPDLARQAELREELCHSATITYLGGKFDPAGKYAIAPILPPASAWDNGDRTLLCGLQTTDEQGTPLPTSGKVVDNDQANIAQAGDCRAVGEDQVLRTVDCAEPHQLETTAVVNLGERFREGFPEIGQQDDFLADRCAQTAEEYMGGEENLYQSTLQVYWGTVLEDSWNGGTRSVNCSLMHANPSTNSFSTIVGSATDGREALSINGAPPTAQPKRNPLRSEAGQPPAPAPAEPGQAPAAPAQ